MKLYNITISSENTHSVAFETFIAGEALEAIIFMKKPEWATKSPLVTYGNAKTFITWNRDQKTRPYLP